MISNIHRRKMREKKKRMNKKLGPWCHLERKSVSFNMMLCLVAQLCPTLVTPWTVAFQALLSMKFSRQVYWSWLPFPTPGDLPDQEIEPASLASPALAGGFFTTAHAGDLLLLEINENENTIFLKLIGCNESNAKKESNGCKYLL